MAEVLEAAVEGKTMDGNLQQKQLSQIPFAILPEGRGALQFGNKTL